jgi:hypothetical protein
VNDAERVVSYRRLMVGRGGKKEEIMNAKPTPILFVAVALSALAAVLASSAQARIPEGQSPQASRTFFVDAKICAALDRAIRVTIQQCSHAHAVPLAAKQFRTGTGQRAVAHKFPAGYRGLP